MVRQGILRSGGPHPPRGPHQKIDPMSHSVSSFSCVEALNRYEKVMKSRDPTPDKGFGKSVEYPDIVKAVVDFQKWEQFYLHPKPEANLTIVREFYAEILDEKQKEVTVRGIKVSFDTKAIKEFYKLPLKEKCFFEKVKKRKDQKFLKEVFDLICVPNPVIEEKNHTIEKKYLNENAQIWYHFLKSRLLTTTHVQVVTREKCILLWCLLANKTVDAASLVFKSIHECAKGKRGKLKFPGFISALCNDKGVLENQEDEFFDISENIKPYIIERITRGIVVVPVVESKKLVESDKEEENQEEMTRKRKGKSVSKKIFKKKVLEKVVEKTPLSFKHFTPPSLPPTPPSPQRTFSPPPPPFSMFDIPSSSTHPSVDHDSLLSMMKADMSNMKMMLIEMREREKEKDELIHRMYEQFYEFLYNQSRFYDYVDDKNKLINQYFSRTLVNFPMFPSFPADLRWAPKHVYNEIQIDKEDAAKAAEEARAADKARAAEEAKRADELQKAEKNKVKIQPSNEKQSVPKKRGRPKSVNSEPVIKKEILKEKSDTDEEAEFVTDSEEETDISEEESLDLDDD